MLVFWIDLPNLDVKYRLGMYLMFKIKEVL
jgi:hypothetical protein